MKTVTMIRPRTGLAASVLLLVAVTGCGDGETQVEQPVPTSVDISPESAILTFIDATQGFTAVVRDQDGKAMPNAAVSWSNSDASVFTVSGSGSTATVTAAGNGTGSLTATSGQASGTAAVEVAQRAARIDIVSGDQQEGIREQLLPEPLVVRLEDQGGTAAVGVEVTFTPAAGSGTVSESPVTTDADGMGSTEWTLGTARNQSLAVVSGGATSEFTARGVSGDPLPDLVLTRMTLSRYEPTILETIEIVAEILNGGDAATPATFPLRLSHDGGTLETSDVPQIEPDGTTTVKFTAGPFDAGSHDIVLTLDPDDEIEEWLEDNNSASERFGVVNQQALSLGESATVQSNVPGPTFLFRVDITEASEEALNVVLSGGSGDADLFVHYGDRPGHTDGYRCNSGAQDTNESCQMVPTRAGTYHIGVYAYSEFGPSTLTATVGGRPLKAYDIELVFLDNGTSSQDNIVRQAAERWESVMGKDAWDYPFSTEDPFPANQCFAGQPGVAEVINDIRVWVSIDSIDGVGGVAASAGPCHLRQITYGFGTIVSTPTLGAIFLDEADVALLEDHGVLESVVTHELAHVLGFGTTWNLREWLVDPSLPNSPNADTHFIGPVTIPAFDAIGGAGYADGAKVPVENGAAQGSSDAHWRESVFGDELMTPYLNLTGDTHPLSLVTIESMYDIWHEVNPNAADAYSLTSAGLAGMHMPRGPVVDLSNDVADWPIWVGDQKTGRLVKVIRPRRGR